MTGCKNTGNVEVGICGKIVQGQPSTNTQINTIIDISNCETTIPTTIQQSFGIVSTVGATSSTINLTNNKIYAVGNQLVNPASSVALYTGLVDISNSNLNINKNTFIVNEVDNVDIFGCGVIAAKNSFVNITNNTITINDLNNTSHFNGYSLNTTINSTININNNISTITNVESTSNINTTIESMINLTNTTLNIANNYVTIGTITDSHQISGILGPSITDLSDVNINVIGNNITYGNIDTISSRIAGISLIDTDNNTFDDCTNFDLTIRNNTIETNDYTTFMNQSHFNNTIFATNVTIDPLGSMYTGPTGTLTIRDNTIIPNKIKYGRNVYYSDNYIPVPFRPYIFSLGDYAGSNYWWDVVDTDIDPSLIDYVIAGRGGTDDTLLRSIFRRAIGAINEQKWFEIYPFYQIKVKGIRS